MIVIWYGQYFFIILCISHGSPWQNDNPATSCKIQDPPDNGSINKLEDSICAKLNTEYGVFYVRDYKDDENMA